MSETAEKPKIVIDTNTWVDAMLAELSPETATPQQQQSKTLTDYALAHFAVVFSVPTMLELGQVAADPNGMTNELLALEQQRKALKLEPVLYRQRAAYIATLQRTLQPYAPQAAPTRCEADKQDQKFLDVAFAAGASLIISRDHHLLDLKAGWCRIITPAIFCHEILREGQAPNLSSIRSFSDALTGMKVAQQVADQRVAKKTGVQPAPAEPMAPPPPALFSEPRPRRPRASFSEPRKRHDPLPAAPPPTALGEKLAKIKDKLGNN